MRAHSTTGARQRANSSTCSMRRLIGTSTPPAPSTINQRPGGISSGKFEPSAIDLHTVQFGGAMRRQRFAQDIAFRPETILGQAGQRGDALTVRAVGRTRLDRLPVDRRRARASASRDTTVLPTSVSVPVTISGFIARDAARTAAPKRADLVFAVAGVDGDAQARGSFGHRRRPDRAHIEACVLQRAAQLRAPLRPRQ